MALDFISVTERRSKTTILINANLITSIKDLRTEPACTEDFYFTVIRCGCDKHEVKETVDEIVMKITGINSGTQGCKRCPPCTASAKTMDIVILNYPTGEVDVIRGLDERLIEAKYEGNIEEYLDDCGYNTHNIHYMSTKKFKLNELDPNEL